MSKKNSSFWPIFGIGAAVIGAASTGAALVAAHNQAKKHNQTTKEYIKGKAIKVLPKKKSLTCDVCGCNPCICADIEGLDFDELLLDDDSVNYSKSPDLFNVENSDITDEDDISNMSMEEQRDLWKNRYEELLKVLTAVEDSISTETGDNT